MNLTNEERKNIMDAASEMMRSFCEFHLAEDRLNIANSLSSRMANIKFPDELRGNALAPYAEAFKEMQCKFFDSLGIPLTNNEFWDWYNKQPPSMDKLKQKWKEVIG